MGADFLEQDVVLTKDGTAIVLQDIYLETTTDVRLRFPDRAREDGGVDYSHMMTSAGLDAVAEYANGIGPWINQIYAGKDFAGQPIITTLVERAHACGLKVHPYTFRRDELPEGVTDFDELLDIFVNSVGIDGFFTDFPDLAYAFLRD